MIFKSPVSLFTLVFPFSLSLSLSHPPPPLFPNNPHSLTVRVSLPNSPFPSRTYSTSVDMSSSGIAIRACYLPAVPAVPAPHTHSDSVWGSRSRDPQLSASIPIIILTICLSYLVFFPLPSLLLLVTLHAMSFLVYNNLDLDFFFF